MKNFRHSAFPDLANKIGLSSFILICLSVVFASQASGAIVINEVYAGGGNTNAPYTNDFVELYNNGMTSVDISGYSIQTSSAQSAMGNFTVCALPTTGDTIIEPGTYYLVQFASGGSIGQPLPSPNAMCSANLAVAGYKVALVSDTTALTAPCPIPGATVVDFVGFGTGSTTGANCFETAAAPTTTNTTSIQRTPIGTDTNNNANDFRTGTPSPTSATITTAAGVNLSGNVVSEIGKGIWRASVMLSGGSLKSPIYTTTDFDGNFNFADVPAGETYVLSVSVKGYKFDQTNILVNLSEDFNQAHFIGTPKSRVGGLK